MGKLFLVVGFASVMFAFTAFAQENYETDSIKTSAGNLEITFIGHGTLMFTFGGTVIHVDPWSRLADYSKMPKADIILLTHHHRDHLDRAAVEKLLTEKTTLILTETCSEKIKGGAVMKNGDLKTEKGLKIEAVPAYNLVHMRSEGIPFHPKGIGNGYVITFGNKRVYVAGDTENIPEMKSLEKIDIAFLPMNLPYTMTPEMVAGAAKMFKPKILYPYHYGKTDVSKIVNLLKEEKEIEIRIRKMK
ncbi:MAG TPA: MBL fold metallo-hydrolase [Desulfobacterales bacterium]|nr:MBL fold metallo-hydrolase [Desulfobacterales bacterium]